MSKPHPQKRATRQWRQIVVEARPVHVAGEALPVLCNFIAASLDTPVLARLLREKAGRRPIPKRGSFT